MAQVEARLVVVEDVDEHVDQRQGAEFRVGADDAVADQRDARPFRRRIVDRLDPDLKYGCSAGAVKLQHHRVGERNAIFRYEHTGTAEAAIRAAGDASRYRKVDRHSTKAARGSKADEVGRRGAALDRKQRSTGGIDPDEAFAGG